MNIHNPAEGSKFRSGTFNAAESGSAEINPLLRDLVETSRFKIWSLLIAAFGDFVEPRGGCIAVSNLIDVFRLLGTDPQVLRTALVRLCDDGCLIRHKAGRNSFYQLTGWAEDETRKKARNIYRHHSVPWNGLWRLVIAHGPVSPAIRDTLEEEGFGELREGVYILPLIDPAAPAINAEGALSFVVNPSDPEEANRILRLGWDLARIDAAYAGFMARWLPVAEQMDSLATLSDLEALAMRLLLIYEFRRCCLAHPPLPLDAASGGSREERARAIASRLWRALLGPSERWLNRHGRRHDGNLPAASRELSLRFLT